MCQPWGASLRKWCAIAISQRWTAAFLGTRCRVGPAVVCQLTTNQTRRPLQAARNYPQRAALRKAQLDQRAFFTAHVFVVRSHGNTLSPDKCCISYLRPPGYTLQTDATESILMGRSLRGNFDDTLTGSSRASTMII